MELLLIVTMRPAHEPRERIIYNQNFGGGFSGR
jgi:hypothetical protein